MIREFGAQLDLHNFCSFIFTCWRFSMYSTAASNKFPDGFD